MFSYLRIFLMVALLAGIGAGVVGWGAHMAATTPLIQEAEVYENAAEAGAPAADEATAHTHEAAPPSMSTMLRPGRRPMAGSATSIRSAPMWCTASVTRSC